MHVKGKSGSFIKQSVRYVHIVCGICFRHENSNCFELQEYVDHSSTLYKFYVLGEKVFYAVKKSTPNVDILMKLFGNHGLKPLVFDRWYEFPRLHLVLALLMYVFDIETVLISFCSLKSLPTDKEKVHSGDSIDHGLVTDAAKWLARNLGLTIFGFDVVVSFQFDFSAQET